jgi:deoxyinosine 3'endonuclease (endonuclease V)
VTTRPLPILLLHHPLRIGVASGSGAIVATAAVALGVAKLLLLSAPEGMRVLALGRRTRVQLRGAVVLEEVRIVVK